VIRKLLETNLGRLRLTGWLEAVSYLLLLFVAMPLKYLAGEPEMVSVVGMAHGVLWMAYVGLAGWCQYHYRWRWAVTGWVVLASLLPFGPFVVDARVLKDIREPQAAEG